MSRIVVLECCTEDATSTSLLRAAGFHVVHCSGGEALLEEVVQNRPGAVIYALQPDLRPDLGVLQLLRRAAPDVPLVLLASEGSLDAQKRVRAFRPIYYAVSPIEPTELLDAVRAAVARPARPGIKPGR